MGDRKGEGMGEKARQRRAGDGRWRWKEEEERRKLEEEREGPESFIEQWACLGKWNFSNLFFLCSFQERPLGQDEIDGNSLLKCPSMLAIYISPLLHFCVNSFM